MIGNEDVVHAKRGAIDPDPKAVSQFSDEQAEPAADWNGGSLGRRLLQPKTIASFLIALAVVIFAISRFDLNLGSVFDEMRHANRGYLLLAVATYYGSIALRAIRWRFLLENAEIRPAGNQPLPKIPNLFVMYLLGWFVNCLVPAKLGDAYRGFLLKRRCGASFGATLGTIFAERLADLMTLGLVLVASGFLVFGRHMPSSVSTWMVVAICLAALLLGGVLFVFRWGHILRQVVPHRVRHHYVRLEEGILGSFGRIPTVLGLTAIIWALEGVRFYFVAHSVTGGFSFSAALFVALLASLLTVVPLTPAGLGFVELGVVGMLTVLGIGQQTAASIALLDRVVAYWSVIVVGAIVYPIVRWAWR
jgi:glycosyltransferase 2 family protein